MQHNKGLSYGATLRTVPTKYKVFLRHIKTTQEK